jgi:aryl-alcohol dehydrogenase-like predicted oxidoreductase
VPDTAQSQWTLLAGSASNPKTLAARLRERGITHLLYSPNDARFVVQRDATGQHQQALDFFQNQFLPACAQAVYQDTDAAVFEITCRS